MPMGPIELADQVGLDICLAVGDMLRSKFGDSLPPTPAWLRDKVAKGELGRKTGKGFYIWKDGKADKAPASPSTAQPTAEMIDRLILPMSNVCVACLREGIVDNADVVDGAMIFGTGYAPFRGGPLNYARTRGVGKRRLDAARAGRRNSAAGSRRMPAGRISSDRIRRADMTDTPCTRREHRNRAVRRSLHPHAGDAGRHQRRMAISSAAGCSARWISAAACSPPRSRNRAP